MRRTGVYLRGQHHVLKRSAAMKRTQMRRTKPLEASGPARTATKLRKCQVKRGGCGCTFTPSRDKQKACGPECAENMGKLETAKTEAKAMIEDKKQTRRQLEALKTIPQLKKEAQREFNKYVRFRDRAAGYDCICCGEGLDWDSGRGGEVDCGHYRSTGSADNLRFVLDNAHAQRVACNRYGSGRAVDYRIGLIARIGLERVVALENNNEVVKWTREGLREIRDKYQALARALEKSCGK